MKGSKMMSLRLRTILCLALLPIISACAASPANRAPAPAAAPRKLYISFFCEDFRTATRIDNIPYSPDESFKLQMTIDGQEFVYGSITSDGHHPFEITCDLPQGAHTYRIKIVDP